MLESARTTAYSVLALVLVANAAMLVALLTNDFSVRYVASNSSVATPTFFKVLALWSADEGSLLLWNLVLGGYLAAVAFRFRARRPETFGWALAAMYGVVAFYLLLVLGPTTPFATLASVPADGNGPLPLLQNHPLMAAHPPFLYLGFIGFTVPFAFAIAGLITGRVSDDWIRITRRWTLAAWTFLAVGLTLGALWSYGVLGWGGYWAWDPVENVALLPWLTATAFLHSVMVQERRGMLKVWNLALVIGTFSLTVLGTFLTRGSILSSVHTFAQSIVGPMYLAFLTRRARRRFRADRLAARRAARRVDARHAAVARERVPRQQRPAAGGHVHRPGRDDLPADRGGDDRREGLRRRTVLQPQHAAGRAAPAVPHGDRAAPAVARGVAVGGRASAAGAGVGGGRGRRGVRARRSRHGGDRGVRARGVRRDGDDRRDGPRGSRSTPRARHVVGRRDARRDHAEPKAVRRPRRAPRDPGRARRRVVGRARRRVGRADARRRRSRPGRGLRAPARRPRTFARRRTGA